MVRDAPRGELPWDDPAQLNTLVERRKQVPYFELCKHLGKDHCFLSTSVSANIFVQIAVHAVPVFRAF